MMIGKVEGAKAWKTPPQTHDWRTPIPFAIVYFSFPFFRRRMKSIYKDALVLGLDNDMVRCKKGQR